MTFDALKSLFTGGIGGFFDTIFGWILGFLPDSQGLPANIQTSISYGIDKVNAFSFIFPISDMVQIVQYLVLFEVAFLGYKITMRVIKLIRGTS